MTIKFKTISAFALLTIAFFTTSFTLKNTEFTEDDEKIYKFLIHLTDKKGTPYSVDKPQEFLSPKALDRRKKENVQIDESDLPVNPSYVEKIAKYKKVRVLYTSKWMNAVVVQVSNDYDVDPIEDLDFVKKIDFLGKWNVPKEDKDKKAPKDDFKQDAGEDENSTESVKIDIEDIMERGYGDAYNQTRMMNMIKMHDMGFQGQGMTIAVIDGGFKNYYRHRAFDSLRANNQILGYLNIVNDDTSKNNNGYHGTSVLSCMGANVRDKMIGTSPKASFWLLNSEASGSEYPIEEANWVRAAEFADSVGVDIITSSLGYREFDDKTLSHTYKDLDGNTAISTMAANFAVKKGIMVLVAAGNEGDGKKWKFINAPADAVGIITVGGVDADREHTSFSSIGPSFDKRIKPDLCAKASYVYVADQDNTFERSNGTSFATPSLAGAVACLMQANPNKKVAEIIEALKQSGDHNHNPDNEYGSGIPDIFIAHSLLNDNPYFDYTKEKLFSPGINEFNTRLFYRFYSPTDQSVTITLTLKGDKKDKIIYTGVHNVKAKGYLQGDIPKVSKLKKGKYEFKLTNASGVSYIRKIEKY